ncbi:MAG: peptidase C11, partial [Clostridia bacterium]|nr:peptidase C11 [Clostridia bacterium]
MENNRPSGRKQNVIGQGASVHKKGEGLNTGPVGKSDGYQGRKEQYSSQGGSTGGGISRASLGKGGGLILILLIAAFFIFGGGKMCSGMLSPSGTTEPLVTTAPQNNQSSSGISGVLGQLMGLSGDDSSEETAAFTNGGTVSTGWTADANNKDDVDTTVATGTRAKYTNILGNGQDTVTIMVYMCGTDLESGNSMATMDLQEMVNAGANSDKLNLIVYTGGCKKWKNNIVSNTVNQIYKVGNGGLACLVKDDGRDPMTKHATLTRFINYCTQNFPANRYELIFWDHGGGSVSGYGYDEKNANYGSMSLKVINDALTAAGTKFDFIGFDACL